MKFQPLQARRAQCSAGMEPQGLRTRLRGRRECPAVPLPPRGKEFLPRAPYHPGNLRSPAEVNELPAACKNRRPEGSADPRNHLRPAGQEKFQRENSSGALHGHGGTRGSAIPGRSHLCPARLVTPKSREGHSLREFQLRTLPFFPAEMQIQASRTRDLWTQQYLCIPAKVRGTGKCRGFLFFFFPSRGQ